MTGCRYKRRKMTVGSAADRSGLSTPSIEGLCVASRSMAPGLDLYTQAIKALTVSCPFDSSEVTPRLGTVPSVLAASLHKSDGRRKHRKFREDAAGKAVRPGRPPSTFSMWERTEAYFRPITVDDIDLLVTRLPPDNCFYIPSSGNVVENVTSDEAIPHQRPLVDVDVGTSSVAGKEESECAQVEPSQDLKFDGEVTCTAALPLEEPELEEKKSLNWILECKQRYLLTPGRLLKKKILFGEDAGLEQLLLLPRMEAASPCCDFCCSGGSDVKSNRLLLCDSCKVSVHQKCYGVHEVPARGWLCSWCKHLESAGRKNLRNSDDENSTSRPCMLCPKTSGALKPLARTLEGSEETKFVHLFCCLWTTGMYVENAGNMEPISNFENLPETRRRLVCNLCKVKHGTCVRCSHGSCRASLHPVCARAAKHQMEIWGKFGVDNVELRVFCSKHSSVQKIERVSKEEHASTIGDLDMVEKLLPENVIKKLPKIRITRKGKDNSARDGKDISIFNGGMKNDSNLDNENLVIQCSSESGDAESMKMERALAVDNANVLQSTSDFSSIFRKIIDRRKISIADVALELGVSCASLESSVMEEGRTIPSELKLKIIQWLQNFVYVQPSACHLKSRNASIILSNCIKSSFDDSSACLLDPNGQDVVMFPELAAPLFAKPPSVSSRMNSKDDLIDYNALTSSVEALLQKNTKQKCAALGGGLPSDCINVAISARDGVSFCNIDNEHHKELNNAETSLGDNTCFVNSNDSKEQFYEDEDMPQGSYMKARSGYSHLTVENKQNSEANISELKTDNLGCSNYASNLGGYRNIEDIGPCSMPYIHPFILKKLCEYQNLWSLLHKQRNIKTGCYGKWSTTDTETVEGCLSDAIKLDQLSKFKSMRAMIFSPTDEIEGELLYLQNCLLDRVNSIKYSCEELIHRMITHLPQEIDAFRKKSWDMVLVNKHLCEVKEAKKRGRKERRHKEAQAILAAATAAAASSRNSMLRKDTVDGISLTQQNPLKISTITRRPKETISRSSVAKISSDKYSGDFKFPNFAMENALFCDVCWRTETLVNRIFVCSNCKVAVHLDCYRRLKDPTGPWRCELCEDASLQSSPKNKQLNSGENTSYRSQCSLCSGVTGAFRKTTDGEWVHAFCAEDAIPMEKDANACCICHYRLGLCLKCSYGHCQAKFHPTCARSAGFFMNIKAIGGRFQHKAYCEKHSVEQREKVDSQHGAEELKNVKLVRVDLEKVRLLCERIIRREKFKRDLVVCSHGILASRRDCVAFSAMVRSSFTPGISSESATTSIDNPSYSEAFQRCDDLVTVDSTAIIHGRRSSCRPPTDVDRKTDDSSTSQLLDKRKLADRAVFSGKHLPQRSADHKGVKTVLQKERAMMALYQASLQEDNSAACDSESC